MSPGVVHEVIEGVFARLRSPLLIFVLILNLGMLAFIYFGVTESRRTEHALIDKLMDQCINLMERQRP